MLGIDKNLQKTEERIVSRLEAVTKRKKRAYGEVELVSKICTFLINRLNYNII